MSSNTIELHEQVVVPRTAADCYRYLADFSTIEQWDPSVLRAEKRSQGAPAAGSRFHLVLSFAGRELPMDYTLDACEPGRSLTLSGHGDGFSALDRITFAEAGVDADGHPRTRIDYRATLDLGGAPAPARWLVERLMQGAGRRAVTGIRDALTVRQSPPGVGLRETVRDRLVLPGMWQFTEAGYREQADKGLTEFMDGQRVVVTGPTSGIGLAAAKALSRLGASLVLVGRGADRLQETRSAIRAFSGAPADTIDCVDADLLTIEATREAANRIAERHERVDVLINNAGALFNRRDVTADGHEQSLAINLIAPWVLTRTLMPKLRAAGGRVINMASGGMYTQALNLDDIEFANGRYNGPKAYARAKRALVAVNEHWAEHEPQVDFHAMHPGWVATPGVSKSLPAFERRLQGRLRDARMGADTAVWLASARAVANDSGRFWFDRKPRATALLPGTGHTAEQAEALVHWLTEKAGC